MPKRPKFTHPVRAVRLALSCAERVTITQQQFGERLGLSGSYVQRVELGQAPAVDNFCRAVALLTGVKPETLKHPKGKPLMWDGKPVSADAIRYWKQFRKSEEHAAIDLFCLKHAELAVVALGLAAIERNRCDGVLLSFSLWLTNAVKEFKLSDGFLRQMKDVSRRWNIAMEKSGDALFVPPGASTESLAAGASAAMRVGEHVRAGNLRKAKFTIPALTAAFDRSFSP